MCLVIKNGILKKADFCSRPGETTAIVPEGVRVIGKQAFKGQKKLTKILLPKSLEVIEAYAFFYCQGLEEMRIPPRVHTIGDRGFSACTRLGAFYVPETVKNCGNEVLSRSSHLYHITVYRMDGSRFVFPVRSSYSSAQLQFLLTGNHSEDIPPGLLGVLLERMVLSGYDTSQKTTERLFELSVGMCIDNQDFHSMKELLSHSRITAHIPVQLYEKMLAYANEKQAFDLQLLLMETMRKYHITGNTDLFQL